MKTTTNLNKQRVYYSNRKGRFPTWGFNCWGATMFVLNVTARLRWVYEWNMREFLEEETEAVVDKIQAGDILVMWSGFNLWHTAVYIGNHKFFHKKGSNCAEITTLDGVKREYPEADRIEYRRMSAEV